MTMNMKIARVSWDEMEYTGPISCYNAFRLATKRHVYPIDVRMRNGEIYLVRRDM